MKYILLSILALGVIGTVGLTIAQTNDIFVIPNSNVIDGHVTNDSAIGVTSDGHMIDITVTPHGDTATIEVSFGQDTVNYDIIVMQAEYMVLADLGSTTTDGTSQHVIPKLLHNIEKEPLDIAIQFNDDKTPRDQILFTNVN